MKTIKLSDKNFKKFKKFARDWIDKRHELIEDCNDMDCIEALTDHVMYDVASAIERVK